MKILITGSGGFMGSHLVDMLANAGHEVYGTYYGSVNLVDEIKNNLNPPWVQGMENARGIFHKSHLAQCDVGNFAVIRRLIADVQPEQIFHLAAQSYPTKSWDDPWDTIQTNIIGTANVFEAVKKLKLKCRILVAGSSAQYGLVRPEDVPVKETHEMKPLHPYGVSKVAQEGLAYQYWKNFDIDAFTMRIFNTTGPRKVGDVCADFTKQLAAIDSGLREPVIKVGNLNTRRAITDVRDELRGFILAMQHCKAGEAYNISGSRAYLIKDILETAISFCKVKPKIEVDPKLLRPTDETIIFGDSARFKEATGWQQEIPIAKTIEDMLSYWRAKLAK